MSPVGTPFEEVYVPHLGWLAHPPDDEVGRFLAEGWFEYREQAFFWLFLREGDVFVDAGAHIGLYSVLASRLVGEQGRVVAVEPNPQTAELLRRNLACLGKAKTEVVQAALASHCGEVDFFSAPSALAAYSATHSGRFDRPSCRVRATSLASLFAELGFCRADLVKVDVEGEELGVLEGAREIVDRASLPLWMIEFTEENLRRRGRSTKELFDQAASLGYIVCAFDEARCRLSPARWDGPVWYDNYFFAADPDQVNARLAACGAEQARIARDLLRRGASAAAWKRAAEQPAAVRIRLEEAIAKAGQFEREATQAQDRAAALERLLESAKEAASRAHAEKEAARADAEAARSQSEASRSEAGAARTEAETARSQAQTARLEAQTTRLEAETARSDADAATAEAAAARAAADTARSEAAALQSRLLDARAAAAAADARASEAAQRAGRAERRADDAHRELENSWRRIGQAGWQADEAGHRADEARRHAEGSERRMQAAERRAAIARAEFELSRSRLHELLSHPAVDLSWKLRGKPDWVDAFLRSGSLGDPLAAALLGPPTMEQALAHLAGKNLDPRVVFDVGAGKGSWSLMAQTFFPDAEYFLAEPLDENEPDLRALSARSSRFHFLKTALGEASGIAEINVSKDLVGSHCLHHPEADPARRRTIPVRSADELIREGLISQPDLFKIDVQGYEMKVLEGAAVTLVGVEALIVEVNLFRFMEGCPLAHEVIAFLAARDFVLFDVAGLLRRPYEDDLGQIDLVLVNAASRLVESSRWR